MIELENIKRITFSKIDYLINKFKIFNEKGNVSTYKQVSLIKDKFLSELFFKTCLKLIIFNFVLFTLLGSSNSAISSFFDFKALTVAIVNLLFLIVIMIIILIGNLIIVVSAIKKLIIRNKSRNRDLEKSLKYMMYSNKLFTEELIEVSEGKKEKVIVRQLNIFYKCDLDEIKIKVFKLADEYTSKASELELLLESALRLRLYEKIESIDYVLYRFKYNTDKQIIVGNSNYKNLYPDEIKINSSISFRLSKNPHILLAGITGGGKTTFLNFLILRLLSMKSDIYIADPKESDLSSLSMILGKNVASDVNNICRIAREVKEKMVNRFSSYKGNRDNYGKNYLDMGLNPIVLIIDELGAFRAAASRDKKNFDDFMSNITQIVLKGREVGVFCVLATQQPNSNNIFTEVRDNLSVRIFLGNPNSEAKRMVFDSLELPNETVTEVGQGFIYFDGLNAPRKVSFPFLDYTKINFLDEVEKLVLGNKNN